MVERYVFLRRCILCASLGICVGLPRRFTRYLVDRVLYKLMRRWECVEHTKKSSIVTATMVCVLACVLLNRHGSDLSWMKPCRVRKSRDPLQNRRPAWLVPYKLPFSWPIC